MDGRLRLFCDSLSRALRNLGFGFERETLKATYGPHPFGTAEAINVHTALRSYTAWAARQLFLEDKVGTIEPGKEADIAVWDHDLYTMPASGIKNLKCELTIFAGRVVYQDAAAGIAARTK